MDRAALMTSDKVYKDMQQTTKHVKGHPFQRVAYRWEWRFKTHPKFRRPSKIVSNSTRWRKLLKIVEFRTSTPQDVSIKGSKILKLPPVRNCFTLAMTIKLVIIINSLKVPKINKILLYEVKFYCAKLQLPPEPLTRGLPPPPDPCSLCPLSSTEFVETPTPPNKIPWYATGAQMSAVRRETAG